MREPRQPLTPLGALFRARRGPLGWERAAAEARQIDPRLKERAMRTYESGGVMPPLDKALILAEYYGIELEELASTVLGRPYKPRNPPGSPEAETASGAPRSGGEPPRARGAPAVGAALGDLDAARAAAKQPRRRSRRRPGPAG